MQAMNRQSLAAAGQGKCGFPEVVFLVALCMQHIASGWNPNVLKVEHVYADKKYVVQVWKTKDRYCPLDVTGTYPYLVKLVSREDETATRQGVILSHQAVLTTSKGFSSKIHYAAVAQRVFYMKGINFKICNQIREVRKRIPHPKWIEGQLDQTYNFQILTLDSMFDAPTDFVYPTIPIQKAPYDYMMFVRKVMTLHKGADGCEMPHMDPVSGLWGYIGRTGNVEIKMTRDECIREFCRGSASEETCRKNRYEQKNYTMICVVPYERLDSEVTKISDLLLDYEYGSPLICNNSGVGLASWYIPRGSSRLDYWIVVSSFVRIWPWMMTYKHMLWDTKFSRKEWDSEYIENHRLHFRAVGRHRPNKNVTLNSKRIAFIGRLRSARSHAEDRLEYSFMFQCTVVLTTVLMFTTNC